MTRTSRKIILTAEEGRELKIFTENGKRSVKLFKRAEIILALDTSEGRNPAKEADIAKRIGVSRQTIQKVKKDFLTSMVSLRQTPDGTPSVFMVSSLVQVRKLGGEVAFPGIREDHHDGFVPALRAGGDLEGGPHCGP